MAGGPRGGGDARADVGARGDGRDTERDEREGRSRLSRRRFLRLSLAASTGLVATGCGFGAQPTARRTIPAAATVSRSAPDGPAQRPTVDGSVGLALDRLGGDAWTWEKHVTGRVVHPERFRSVRVTVGDRSVPARVHGGRFDAAVPLRPGENELSAVGEHQDGRQYASTPVVYGLRLAGRPAARIGAALEGGRIVMDGRGSRPAEGTPSPIASYAWSARAGNPAALALEGAEGARVSISVPEEDGEYYVTLSVEDEAGRRDASTAYFVVEGGAPRLPDLRTEHPAWVDDAVVYGVISRAFGPEGLRDVTRRLDALKDLGVTALWLAPINASTAGFGYEVTDYFALRPDDGGGTDEDFRALVREAHRHGIRVLMDFVPNHSSVEHPYFLDAEEHGERSAYYDYYARDEFGNYTYYFEYDHLANLNYDNPEVRRWMLEAFSYWVREFDVDGFRVDIAWGIREREPEYWLGWRRELQRIKPDLLLIAEAPGRDPYYYTEGYDAAYDWAEEYGPEYDWYADLGQWAWETVFDLEDEIPARLHTALTNDGRGFHPDALLFRFLNNNDTGPRFVSNHGPDLTRVAAALLLTLPGIPCVYTGDEVGAEFEPYDEGCCIDWEDDKYGFREHYARLIALRHRLPALRSRRWTHAPAKPTDRVYAYIRALDAARDPALVVLNWRAEDADAEIRLPEEFRALGRDGTLRDALSGEGIRVRGGETLTVPVPGYSALVLVEG